jgi:cytochrome c oxidase accessory protein FixG
MCASLLSPAEAPGPVLPTLNPDGSRRRIRPRIARGTFWRRRRAVAYALMAIFVTLPYLRIAGEPAILLDIAHRRFTLFGTTYLPTDAVLFMLLLLAILIGVVTFTALFGRVWCGWACPQTVYMEFLFRPIESWIEGGRTGSQRLDRAGGLHPRRFLKQGIILILSLLLAHVFLAYFVGVDRLAVWVRQSPLEHPGPFLVMLVTGTLVVLDFGWFREQTCLVACPYGRLQSALLDRRSTVVSYDLRRGEPRKKGLDRSGAGACIDCGLCVLACPTGIDIRDGLQMECIHCTQCMDACDSVMDRFGWARGLIRYSHQDALEGRATRRLRPRVLLYLAALAIVVGTLAFDLGTRATTDVTLLRGLGAPYQVAPDGRVTSLVRVKLVNRGRDARRYRIELVGSPEASMVAPISRIPLAPGTARETGVFVTLPGDRFATGQSPVTFRIRDDRGIVGDYPYRLVGPEPASRAGEERR